ncbi:hypothetical protein [Terriglobus roseus]|uniref:Uncharacterized protein n=1 Tax=Terriglobus roseus TaxID=392734 RepID=A0A1H4LRR1_9BACT|nr:hypothetical protein [Terriglobus roseus]SEB73316.1 hypothetical protein SAMN05443244_1691 [Terriglobus roseus]
MKHARSSLRRFVTHVLPLAAAAVAALPIAVPSMRAQMHKVAAPDQVTRAVGVYEYVGDAQHPRAARFIPVSLFIGGHFEDAGVYLARPIPFAIQTGFRYELQKSGTQQNFLDLLVARNFASSASAAAQSFDDGWFAYGHVVPPTPPRTAKLKANCNPSTARVVKESDNGKKDDSKPHFGSKSDSTDDAKSDVKADAKPSDTKADSGPRFGRRSAPDPCQDDDPSEHITLSDDSPKDKNTPDPERPTLHRSPETTANNTGAAGKPDKKAPKPPPATVTANSGPADDLDRPKIRHRTTDEDDPNALPPDPIDLASHEAKAAKAKDTTVAANNAPAKSAPTAVNADGSASTNTTSDDGSTISAGSTMSGGPVLRRGRVSAPPPEPAQPKITAGQAAALAKSAPKPGTNPNAIAPAIPAPLDSLVAVSDAKERAPHDYRYKFASNTERATVVNTLEDMARAVLANPALATDAPSGAVSGANTANTPASKPSTTKPVATKAAGAHTTAHTGSAATRTTTRSHAAAKPVAVATAEFADEEVNAFQLYFSAPITYTFSARMPATDSTPERYVTIVAQTDAEGRLQPAMRSVTDAMHLDRTPRYRLIDVVDADGSNRASLLMELRMQHARQFALYRLLGNKPDQIFVSGSTLL